MKLYEMLQDGLSSTEIYQSLISQEQAPNVLLAGNFSLLPIYTPSDPDGEIRKGLLRKIMARYYNYETFTPDALYFGSRMFWRLNQIMPTYAAKFNATVPSDEFADAFLNGIIVDDLTRTHKGNSQSSGTSTGTSRSTSKSESSSESNSASETETNNQTTSFESDYPQVIVGDATAYNSAASRSIGKAGSNGSGSSTDSSAAKSENDNTNTTENNTSGSSNEEWKEFRRRHLTPDEIALTKQRIMSLIMNLDEEIVNSVSDMFENVWHEDECDLIHKKKVEHACRQILAFSIKLNALNNRINELDFTDEEIGYIEEVPGLNQEVAELKEEAAKLQGDIDDLATVLLPEVTPADFGKVLMVTETGEWGAVRLPNWAEVGF